MITIVNYGMGNLGSIRNMLQRIGVNSEVVSSKEGISKANKIIMPGVGSFDLAMKNLNAMGLVDALNEKVLVEKVPVLGICLGMQIMAKESQEGILAGLGWIEAVVKKFNFPVTGIQLKIPHMGWNSLEIKNECILLKDMPEDLRFYFVHSYHVVCKNDRDIIGLTNYGFNFVSVFKRENIMGVQFHPEKSHVFGLKLLSNFALS